MNTTKRGDISAAKILAKFVELGYQVLVPWGSAPYDLALDCGDRLVRVQCKTGRLRKGCVLFNTSSIVYGGRRIGYTDKADLFAVYCPDTNAIYTLPVAEAATGFTQLRVEAAGNNHSSIRWARDYELRQQLHHGPVV